MRASGRAVRLMSEVADAMGIARDRVFDGIGDPEVIASGPVEWPTLVALLERVSRELGDDPERVRDFGARMTRVPSYDFLQRLARGLVPLRVLFEAGARWVSPALFPQIPLEMTFLDGRRVRFHAELPAWAAGSRPFFHVFEGTVREAPTLLGMPPAVVLESDVGTHHVDCVLELPPQPSLLARARRAAHALMHAREIQQAYEAQRIEVERGMDELLRATRELRELFDRLPDFVVIHKEGTILWVNRACAAGLGHPSAESLVGASLASIVHESSRPILADRLQRAPVTEGLPAFTEVRLLRRDGEALLAEVAPAQAVTYGGRPARLVVARDVTERARLHQSLVTADRLAALGLLAAGVAHEINNPLAYAMMSVEVAARDLGRDDGAARERVRESLATALQGLGRVRGIVRDLRRLSRAGDERVGPVDVAQVIESTLALAANEIARRARVVRDYAPVPPALAAEARLGQVVLNLVVNAIEALPDGAPETNELRVRTCADDQGRVVIEIADTGSGIPPEVAARIFDPFFTTKPIGRGTGLGLSICHRLVTDLGGSIDVRSTPGRGTTFRVALPSAPRERQSNAAPAPARAR